jgi:hypothetical protein
MSSKLIRVLFQAFEAFLFAELIGRAGGNRTHVPMLGMSIACLFDSNLASTALFITDSLGQPDSVRG